MSWRAAAVLARALADESRCQAAECGIDAARAARFKKWLWEADNQALAAWVRLRRAQDLDEFAAHCERRAEGDITAVERRRP